MRRLINLLTAVAVVIVTTVPFVAFAQSACGTAPEQYWRVFDGPRFTSGGQTITHLAVDAQAPSRVFVTNGTQLMRSTDGMCSWKPVFDASEETSLQAPAAGAAIIKGIGMSERGATPAYLLVEQQVGPVSRPRVFVGSDNGSEWAAADTGLPPAGTPELLRVAPSDPETAYVVIDAANAADAIFATTNGGSTWSPRGQSPAPTVNDLKVDPTVPNDLWLGGGNGLYHSTDGGSSWAADNEHTGKDIGPIDVFHRGGPARVLTFSRSEALGRVSEDGGQTWLRITQPGAPQSVAHGSVPDSVLISTGSKVYAFAPTILTWVDLNAPIAGVKNLTADTGTSYSFFGHTARQIAVYTGPTAAKVKIPKNVVEIPDISLIDSAPPDVARRSRLFPVRSRANIPAGKEKTLPYDLSVPRVLTPLDVVFVVDTSSSMTQVIHEAADALEGIHNGLAASGAAVEFGLVEYRSYPTDVPPREPPGDVTDNYVYQRVLDVGATAPEMENGIRDLVAAGGGIYDAQLEALWQLATGSGRDVWPPGPSTRDVPPGLQVNFRKKALRVVLHVGDEPFGTENSDDDSDNNITRPEGQVAKPDIPEMDAVADALRDKDIRHLGLSLYPDATPDLRQMASATGSFAPPGGVDCDRDGATDVQGGDPLVCVLRQDEITDANITPAIVELVEAVRTKSQVELDVQGPGAPLVQAIRPNSYSSVLLQADNTLDFEITYRCPRSMEGERRRVEVTARGLIGTPPLAETLIVCGEIEPEDEPPPLRFEQFVTLVPVFAVAPPPPPVNVSSSAQAQAQAQANAAFAAQEQEQPQVAMVHQMHAEAKAALAREEAEYSFTSLRREDPSYLPFGAATILMSSAFGVAMTLRRRAEVRLRYATNKIRR